MEKRLVFSLNKFGMVIRHTGLTKFLSTTSKKKFCNERIILMINANYIICFFFYLQIANVNYSTILKGNEKLQPV